MICSALRERLGNILFEIAAGASLAKRLNETFVAWVDRDCFNYEEYKVYVEQFRKSILRKIDFVEVLPQNQRVYTEPFFHYQALPVERNLTIKGYFQSEKYFDKELVRDLFAIDEHTKSYIETKYGSLLQKEPVSIHIRRGDYKKLKLWHVNCPLSYYQEAIRHFPTNTNFLIFSDDISWCKRHFIGEHFFFSENESALTDLYLQSFCRHHIIGNSTFSWWGAWLDPRADKKVIYPGAWFGILYKYKTKDLCPNEWMKLPIQKSIFDRIEILCLLIKYYLDKVCHKTSLFR